MRYQFGDLRVYLDCVRRRKRTNRSSGRNCDARAGLSAPEWAVAPSPHARDHSCSTAEKEHDDNDDEPTSRERPPDDTFFACSALVICNVHSMALDDAVILESMCSNHTKWLKRTTAFWCSWPNRRRMVGCIEFSVASTRESKTWACAPRGLGTRSSQDQPAQVASEGGQLAVYPAEISNPQRANKRYSTRHSRNPARHARRSTSAATQSVDQIYRFKRSPPNRHTAPHRTHHHLSHRIAAWLRVSPTTSTSC